VNLCISVATALTPQLLLGRAQEWSVRLAVIVRWSGDGDRAKVDIDILAYEAISLSQRPNLTLPHPHLFERAFVLVPLAEICAGTYDRRLCGCGMALAPKSTRLELYACRHADFPPRHGTLHPCPMTSPLPPSFPPRRGRIGSSLCARHSRIVRSRS